VLGSPKEIFLVCRKMQEEIFYERKLTSSLMYVQKAQIKKVAPFQRFSEFYTKNTGR
jgi:hypothetical protein